MAKQRNDYNHLPEWLPPRIQALGISFERFARNCGISRAQLYKYFDDTSRPGEQTMARMCHVLKVPLEEGLRQYVPKINGRPVGSGGSARELSVRRK